MAALYTQSHSLKLLFQVLILSSFGQLTFSNKRDRVVVIGTTTGPNFKRIKGIPSFPCPEAFPFNLNYGKHCCSTYWQENSNDGGSCISGEAINRRTDLECCPSGRSIECPGTICSGRPFVWGSYSTWSSWGTCDGNTFRHSRERACHDGDACMGAASEIQACCASPFSDEALICHVVNSSSGAVMGYSDVHEVKLNYADAKAACEGKDMELAMPRTQEQYDKLVQLGSVDDMDLWVGLTNPGEDRCANETCLNFIAWDNDEREKVTEEEIFGRGIEFNNPTECIRIMIGVPMMDDLYCSSMFHFVCQREYQ